MKRRTAYPAMLLTAHLAVLSGCTTVVERPPETVVVESHPPGPPPWAPAHGYRRKHETYYYYPVVQVYYYPTLRRYYWLEGSQWRFGARLPRYYVIERERRVVLNLDYEPHTKHSKIKTVYPPGYFAKGKGKGKGR